MEDAMLKVSIITVCYNAAYSIERTIVSVANQTYKNIEYIIIDGASTDETMSIVKKHAEFITLVVSEKDKGIYDAMNKGVLQSTGDILYFLNSDDQLFAKDTIGRVVSQFQLNSKANIIYGKVKFINIPDKIINTFKVDDFEYKKSIDLVLKRVIPQQCFFVKRMVFDVIGLFDVNYKICGDYDWFLRSAKKGIPRTFIDLDVGVVDASGRSFKDRYQVIPEKISSVYRNSSIVVFCVYFIVSCFRKIKHFFCEEFLQPLRSVRK